MYQTLGRLPDFQFIGWIHRRVFDSRQQSNRASFLLVTILVTKSYEPPALDHHRKMMQPAALKSEIKYDSHRIEQSQRAHDQRQAPQSNGVTCGRRLVPRDRNINVRTDTKRASHGSGERTKSTLKRTLSLPLCPPPPALRGQAAPINIRLHAAGPRFSEKERNKPQA